MSVWAGRRGLVRMRWTERRRRAAFLSYSGHREARSYLSVVAGLARVSRGSSVMAGWVFCNSCFQSPHRKSSFSLTSCGHVYCHSCLLKGPCRPGGRNGLKRPAGRRSQCGFTPVGGTEARNLSGSVQLHDHQAPAGRRSRNSRKPAAYFASGGKLVCSSQLTRSEYCC